MESAAPGSTRAITAGCLRRSGILVREGARASAGARRGGALRRARDGLPDLDLRAVAGRRRTSSASTARSSAIRSSTSGAATSSGACSGELSEIPGAILEVGVWRGGSGALMASRWPGSGSSDTVYLCDTWEGVVKTGPDDIYYHDGKHDDTSQGDRRGARAARLGLTQRRAAAGDLSRTTRPTGHATGASGSCTSTSTSTSPPRTCSTGPGRVWPGGVVVFDDYGFPGLPGGHAVRRRAAQDCRTGWCCTTSTATGS